MFSTFPLPSQETALKYFEKVAEGFGGNFILGGHSKGGNLAVYAASFCSAELQDRIDSVYSLDGPGFERNSLDSSGFDKISERIHTFVPQSSVFGMLFEHKEPYTVVQSNSIGFLQHDIYSWEVERDELTFLSEKTSTSDFFDHVIKSFFSNISIEEKACLTEGVFEILNSAGVLTFDEMLENLPWCISQFLITTKNMNRKTRALIFKQIGRLIKTGCKYLPDINPFQRKSPTYAEQSRFLRIARRRYKREMRLKRI